MIVTAQPQGRAAQNPAYRLIRHSSISYGQFSRDCAAIRALVRGLYLPEELALHCESFFASGKFASAALDLLHGHEYGGVFVFHQKHDEFRCFGLTGVPSDNVKILGTLVESLTSC
jgi:hypothetical protein